MGASYWFTVRISLTSEPSVACHFPGHRWDEQDCAALLESGAHKDLIEAPLVLKFFRRELEAGVVRVDAPVNRAVAAHVFR